MFGRKDEEKEKASKTSSQTFVTEASTISVRRV
jgi:hypothetical protein